jgi:hypothetical protein
VKVEHIFGCKGFPLLRLGRWRAELWLVPRGVEIPDHIHPHLAAWLVPLWGRMIWRRAGKAKRIGPIGPVRPMKVKAGAVHGALAESAAAFLTIERWLPGVPITSAAIDLKLA